MKIFVTMLFILPLGIGSVIAFAQSLPETLTLDEAITLAIDTDPWLTGSQYTQQALTDEATAAATLPDPRMSLMAGNFPVDTFDLNQEAKIGRAHV